MISEETIEERMAEAEEQAFRALRGHRFTLFAHYAELWVELHRLTTKKHANPFTKVAAMGRGK